MTTTTKLFVILVCLFAFIFTPMAIQFAGRTHDWRQFAMNLQDAVQTAVAAMRSAEAVAASEIEHYRMLREREQEKVRAHEQRIAQLERELDRLTQTNAQLARDRDSWKTSTEWQIAQMGILVQHNRDLTETRNRLTESESDLKARNIQLNDRVKELTADLTVRTQQLDQETQKMASCRNENQQLREQLGIGRASDFLAVSPSPTVRPESPVAPRRITGEVIDVRGDLVTVNVGKHSGVQEGMTLAVVRGENFVCDLMITPEVAPNEAVGRIGLTERQVRRGDVVVDLQTLYGR